MIKAVLYRILGALTFVSIWEVYCPQYYQAGDKIDKCKAKILKCYPDLVQLMEGYETAQMEQTDLGRFHEFSAGVQDGARLVLEMLKEL